MDIDRLHFPLLAAISASLFCTPLMMAGVNAILPELGETLNATATQLALVGTFYTLGLAIFQLATGSLGDIHGHRRIFLAGALLFSACSLALGFVKNIPLFFFLRFIQGSAGALISASGLALVASIAPPEKRTVYFGLTGAAVYSGIAMGPPVAGIVSSLASWEALFWLNSCAMLIVFFLMKFTVNVEWRPAPVNRTDWAGFILYAGAMVCLSSASARIFPDSWLDFLLFALFLGFLTCFYFTEKKRPFPLLNISLLAKRPVFALSALAAFVNYASFFGLIFYFSFYIQIAKGIGVRETGFILALQPLVQALATPLATRLCKKFSDGPVCAGGAFSCGIGLLCAAFINLDSSLAWIFIAQILLGFGISLFSLANTTMMIEAAGKQHTGQASALTGAVRTAGQFCSMAFITFSLGWFLGNVPVSREVLDGFMRSMQSSLFIFAFLNLLAIGIALLRNSKKVKVDRARLS